MARIVVVEDDPEWALLLQRILQAGGHEVRHFPTPGRLFDALLKDIPDLVILDMQLPGMHGREIVRVLRANEATRRLLVVAVSAHEKASADAVKCIENGADEYFSKPVDPDLLLARVGALLRRSPATGASFADNEPPPLQLGPLTVFMDRRTATLKDKPLVLTHLEFELLVYFLRQPNRVLTRSLILETVWRTSPDLSTRTVDKHVETLRKKLGSLGALFETVIGSGYLLRVDGETPAPASREKRQLARGSRSSS
jgi:DNA-binding response OmpR family regulator